VGVAEVAVHGAVRELGDDRHAALVVVAANHAQDAIDELRVKARADQLLAPPAAIDDGGPCDPRIVNLWRNLRMLRVRLLLYIGIWVLMLYNAFSVLMIRNLTREHYGYAPDLLFPSVFIMCNLMWSLLWVADCSTRPDRGTVVAAGGFLCITTAFFMPLDFFVLNM
jgi:hypothetical protein